MLVPRRGKLMKKNISVLAIALVFGLAPLAARAQQNPVSTAVRASVAQHAKILVAGAEEMLDLVLAAEPARADATALRSSIRTRKAIAFWVPVVAVVLVPLLAVCLERCAGCPCEEKP